MFDRRWLLGVCLLLGRAAQAATLTVNPGESVQAAIVAADAGDEIRVAAGVFDEDLDFLGKAIAVVGSGPDTVIRGTGTGPVVRFAAGETAASVLDSVTVTGGLADRGGGILIVGSSPTIVRCVVTQNRARGQGSGIYLEASSAQLLNNLITYNRSAAGDPHSVEIVNASPRVVNNTIARGDSNGIIIRGPSAAVILNNVLAQNGSVAPGDRRGRGICDFSGGLAVIRHNLFHRNRIGALLTNGRDWRRIETADREIGLPRLAGNVDGAPRFTGPIRLDPARTTVSSFVPAAGRRSSRAPDGGDPDPAYADVDGSRNDIGFTGGPFAAPR